jgi:hypothetical protein
MFLCIYRQPKVDTHKEQQLIIRITKKQARKGFILLILVSMATVIFPYSITQRVQAQTSAIITIIGYDGTSRNYTLAELQSLPATSGYGGFYQPNQQIINNGLWTGASLLYLCNQVHGLNSTCTVTVTGQGVNNFTYSMVANGLGFNPTYKTYNNVTGSLQNQTLPVTAILAYQVNGTSLPSGSLPAPRLVIVGSEGLLMDGSGGRSITQISITNTPQIPEFPSWEIVVLFFVVATLTVVAFESKKPKRSQVQTIN